ncbi:TetR/AcrR family transcriptional regulator [Mycolicibacterium monacense]|uniref:TetR family transcriptional regulator n=1 Tax=Mycolicibacterium monacense TaxID=85693 RepID=A0AAD1J5V5_MYCMB|nr:TetR/AcrR family transcriptional regulator [Mycolicibacterium monacense]MDA4103301.1 TetR family transcriptional regulator [Mycolicibacterium monacense DSM 44395]OBB56812.1 TetR family transcriptional regulator [Mycolicibacterium monacense]ORB21172.1 TetR family transcriptional regulator [Mycolicibacterium monacense DSM 44395]QHP88896.1 TetR/AcrR family transcriptional regulator [Mycolicibacterium monacense DSM 44395]BBZ63642.1 TetR family transcriptional regulator [Mycolicibacterium monace
MDRVSTNDGTRVAPGLAIAATEPPRRGRPRNAELRAAVLRAATDLALAGGTGAVSIDAIAKRAAVSRTTIYKWWPSAAAIVLEGLLASMQGSIVPPTGSGTRGALDHQVRALNAILADATTGPLFRRVIAAAGTNGEVATALLDQWLLPRRSAVTAVLLDGIATGELRGDLDVDVTVDALFSPAYYRLMFGMPPLDETALTDLLEMVWRGCARPEPR